MALTAESLLQAFGFGYNALGFETEADALADIEGDGGALPTAISAVSVPVRAAIKNRAVSVEAAVALAYPGNADAQSATLADLRPLLEGAQKKYGLSNLNAAVVSPAPDYIQRSNEFRIQANQDLAKAIELLESIVASIPAPPKQARTSGGSVQNGYGW